MPIKKTTIKAFKAVIHLGLEYHYDKRPIDKNQVIAYIQQYQDQLIEQKKIYLSCSITKSLIVLSGQKEEHLQIGFINYPKFPLSHKVLKTEIEKLARSLMDEFQQNRLVIEYLDQTLMLEKSDEIDSRIKTDD